MILHLSKHSAQRKILKRQLRDAVFQPRQLLGRVVVTRRRGRRRILLKDRIEQQRIKSQTTIYSACGR